MGMFSTHPFQGQQRDMQDRGTLWLPRPWSKNKHTFPHWVEMGVGARALGGCPGALGPMGCGPGLTTSRAVGENISYH